MKYNSEMTLREILSTDEMQKYLGLLLPPGMLQFIPERFRDVPIGKMDPEIPMPWGAPFQVNQFLDLANRVHTLVHEKPYRFVPLWSAQEDPDYLPEVQQNSKDSVFLSYRAEQAEERKPAVIIVPGGGYMFVSLELEGFDVAQRMEAAGFRAFVLHYRVQPNLYPAPQTDLALAAKYVRANAHRLGVDAGRLLFVGFSAGGHLCATEALYQEEYDRILMRELEKDLPELAEQYREVPAGPDGLVLGYPVISLLEETHEGSMQAFTGGDAALRDKLSVEKHMRSDFPETFLWACSDDPDVPVSNTRRMAEALRQAGVPFCQREYPTGGHGISLGTGTSAEGWVGEMLAWYRAQA